MPAMLMLLLNYVIFLTPTNIKTVAAVSKCEKIDTTLLPNCQKIGYNFTANFSYVGLQNYQALVSTEVVRFSDRFRNCSRHAEALVCGRYVPKCSENVDGPVLPCREVCEQFVDDCANLLTNNGLYYQYVAYCRLLSSEMESSKQCFKPLGFVPRANLTTERRLPSCKNETKPACLNDKLHRLGNRTRTRLQSFLHDLAPVLNSNCSLNLKRLACFLETSPCAYDDGRTLEPCPSLCQEVRSSCEDEFKKHNVFFPMCISNHAESSAGYGLCDVPQRQVPWPITESNTIRCFCSNCTNNNECTTDGSCFVQHNVKDKGAGFVQTCIDKGPHRDSICNSVAGISTNAPNARCCEKDFCNGKRQVITTMATTVEPTENTVEPTNEGESDLKNVSGTTKPAQGEGKNGIASGILALIAVGILIVICVVVSLGYYVVKKIKAISKSRKPENPKYVNKSNISGNGKVVTIGDSNKGFEEGSEVKTDTAIYY
ncbi:uncharacterized protein [Acropora muricata]|uniref:uncharacterized protein isoform X2 n=1 Tax=Acropora muricata TaxID=159855 RepID=UPI0034E61AAF